MSARRLSKEQPANFEFTPENLEWAKREIQKYPHGRERSAVIPLLWCAQRQNDGWVSEPAMRVIADMLGMAYIRVYEVATFYTMFNLQPIGRYHVQLCGTTPCWLRGADDLKAACNDLIGPKGTTSADGLFTWSEVECLGACVNAPMVQINDDFYEDLDESSFRRLLHDLKTGQNQKPGSLKARTSSEPEGGATTLVDPVIYDAPIAAQPVHLKGKSDDTSSTGKV